MYGIDFSLYRIDLRCVSKRPDTRECLHNFTHGIEVATETHLGPVACTLSHDHIEGLH